MFYFWKTNTVHIEESNVSFLNLATKYSKCFVVDTAFSELLEERYGMFVLKNKNWHWICEPQSEFPPQFKVTLLLMGVV